MRKKEFMEQKYNTCPECGYNNKKDYTKVYGDCLKCHYILDSKVYFKRNMNKSLRLWRGKFR